MKLLFLLPRIPFPLTDGGAVATYNQLKYLQRAGHDISVLALNPRKFHQSPDVIQEVCRRIITVDADTNPSPVLALFHIFSQPPYRYRRFLSAEFSAKLQALLKSESFDLIIMDQTPMVLYARELKQLTNTPLVLRSHNVEYALLQRVAMSDKQNLTSWYLGKTVKATRKMETEYYGLCNAIIPMSEGDAELIRGLGYNGRLKSLALGVNLENFTAAPGVSPKPNTLAYFGSFDWLPNADAVDWLMAEIFPALRNKLPLVELHLGGRNPDQKIIDYGQHAGVFVHPNVPSAADFLHKNDILLVPLRIGGGMRVKIVEAMAAGKAIISTSVGAEGINYTDGKDILIANSAEEFVAATSRLLNNSKLKQSLGLAARETAAQHYTWEALTAKLDRFLTEFLHDEHTSV